MKNFKITFNAPVVLGFVALCFIATLSNYLTLGAANRILFTTFHSPLLSPFTYIRFFTHVLGHMDWSHFIGNASFLLLLGPMLEEKYGDDVIVFVILVTGLITGIINYIFFPGIALCGASGVVFAFILMTSFTSFKDGEIPITFILIFCLYIGQQVYEGIFVNDNISNMAHIVGGLVGSVVGYGMNKK